MDNIKFKEKRLLKKKCRYCDTNLGLKKAWLITVDGKSFYACKKCIPNKEYYEEKKYSNNFKWDN